MMLQAILGVLLEIVHNYKRISVVYLTSVLGGSLFMTVLSPRTYVVGASGGVYGLLGSHLSTIILNWNQMDWKRCRLFWLLFYILGNFLLQAVVVELNVRKIFEFEQFLVSKIHLPKKKKKSRIVSLVIWVVPYQDF